MIERLLYHLPARLRRKAIDFGIANLEGRAYARLAERGYRPSGIIDIGAHEGNWTRSVREMFPDSRSLMIEASETQRRPLEAVCAELEDCTYQIALLGSEEGREVTFFRMGTGSSIMPEASNVARDAETLVTRRLDDLVAGAGLSDNLFVKIDVQGAELEVLKGGEETLSRASMVQLEVALLPFNKGAPDFLEVVSFMDARSLVPFDVAGMVRPYDRDLVQMDILFAPRDSVLRPTQFVF